MMNEKNDSNQKKCIDENELLSIYDMAQRAIENTHDLQLKFKHKRWYMLGFTAGVLMQKEEERKKCKLQCNASNTISRLKVFTGRHSNLGDMNSRLFFVV